MVVEGSLFGTAVDVICCFGLLQCLLLAYCSHKFTVSSNLHSEVELLSFTQPLEFESRNSLMQ